MTTPRQGRPILGVGAGVLTLAACAWLLVAALPRDLTPPAFAPVVASATRQLHRIGLDASHDVFEGKVGHRWTPSHHCWRVLGRTPTGTLELGFHTGSRADCRRPRLRLMERERDLVVSGLFHRYLVGLGHPRAEQRETAVDELRRLRKLGRFADWVCRDRARAGVTLQQVFVILDLSRRHLDTGEIRALQATVHQYDCITRKRIRGVPPQARELLRDLQPEIDREH